MDQSFSKKEKLKNKILLQQLFSRGKTIKKYPIKLLYLPIAHSDSEFHQIGVTVPKARFKRAVDRIYLKRLMREAFRKNKYLVVDQEPPCAFMFIYIGGKKEDYSKIFSVTKALLENFAAREQK